MPFEELTSNESQFRLAVCRPHGAFEDATADGGVPTYAHATGLSHFKARSIFQLSSMMGFVRDLACFLTNAMKPCSQHCHVGSDYKSISRTSTFPEHRTCEHADNTKL